MTETSSQTRDGERDDILQEEYMKSWLNVLMDEIRLECCEGLL